MPLSGACSVPANSSQSSVRELSCKRVLVVEDDADAAELLGLVLEQAGYEVCVVDSVASAIQSAPILQPHVVLIDLGLPDGHGYDLLAALRAQPMLGPCRFVATTGYGDREIIARSLALGFDEHLIKPLHLDVVLAAVARSAAHEYRGGVTNA
jgi:CheY-like chemotaxis protein